MSPPVCMYVFLGFSARRSSCNMNLDTDNVELLFVGEVFNLCCTASFCYFVRLDFRNVASPNIHDKIKSRQRSFVTKSYNRSKSEVLNLYFIDIILNVDPAGFKLQLDGSGKPRCALGAFRCIFSLVGFCIGVDFGGQPGHMPPIIEKRPCIYHFLPPSAPNILVCPPNILVCPQYFGLPSQYFGLPPKF